MKLCVMVTLYPAEDIHFVCLVFFFFFFFFFVYVCCVCVCVCVGGGGGGGGYVTPEKIIRFSLPPFIITD